MQTTEQSAPILEPSTSKSQHIRPTGVVCDRWHNPKLELACLSTHLVHDGCAAAEGAEKGDSAVLQPGQLEVLQGGQHSAVVQPGSSKFRPFKRLVAAPKTPVSPGRFTLACSSPLCFCSRRSHVGSVVVSSPAAFDNCPFADKLYSEGS